jgi:L-methionine (R)-S-oxide reductase
MPNQFSHAELLRQLREIARHTDAKTKLPFETVQLLKDNCPYYDWVGIYTLESADELVLGPFLGKPSPHTRIKVGDGICGAAVREEDTIIVDDVNSDPRYLSCSIETKSEIVVPIFNLISILTPRQRLPNRTNAFSKKSARYSQRHIESASA